MTKQVPLLCDCGGDKDGMMQHQESCGSITGGYWFSLLSEQTPSHRKGFHGGAQESCQVASSTKSGVGDVWGRERAHH